MLRMIVALQTLKIQASQKFKKTLANQKGGISIEYGLLIAVIVIGMISAASFILGGDGGTNQIQVFFTEVMNSIRTAAGFDTSSGTTPGGN